jgi:hypothetical protein
MTEKEKEKKKKKKSGGVVGFFRDFTYGMATHGMARHALGAPLHPDHHGRHAWYPHTSALLFPPPSPSCGASDHHMETQDVERKGFCGQYVLRVGSSQIDAEITFFLRLRSFKRRVYVSCRRF